MRRERRKRRARKRGAVLGTSDERQVLDRGALSYAGRGTLHGGEEFSLHAFREVDSGFALGLRCRIPRGSVSVAHANVAEELV